jgi:hypothetical protein
VVCEFTSKTPTIRAAGGNIHISGKKEKIPALG